MFECFKNLLAHHIRISGFPKSNLSTFDPQVEKAANPSIARVDKNGKQKPLFGSINKFVDQHLFCKSNVFDVETWRHNMGMLAKDPEQIATHDIEWSQSQDPAPKKMFELGQAIYVGKKVKTNCLELL